MPSFRRSAGARFTVIRLTGKAKPLFFTAERTRFRASFTAASGSPTTSKAGSRRRCRTPPSPRIRIHRKAPETAPTIPQQSTPFSQRMISCYCTVSPGKLQHTAGGTANFFDLFFPSTPASSPGPAGGPAPSGPPIPRHDLSTFPRLPAHRRRPSIPRPGTSPPPVAPAALPWTFSRAVRGIALLFSLPALFFCGLYRFPTLNR